MSELTPVIVQDARDGTVLMLGYGNEQSSRATEETGFVHFWSRSRDALWKKGETSGNTLRLIDMTLDCDGDTWLIRAEPSGPTCHTGAVSCFGDRPGGLSLLASLEATIISRRADPPPGSYTASLLAAGTDACARKVLEEATEVAFAAKDDAAGHGSSERIAEEAADLVYHLLVLLADREVPLASVLDVLLERSR